MDDAVRTFSSPDIVEIDFGTSSDSTQSQQQQRSRKPDKAKDAENLVDHLHFDDDVETEAKDLKTTREHNSKGKVQAGKDEKDKEGKDKKDQ